ncbi:hypothetical protein LAZ09_25590, partial [Escherichia coli]|nr:hypothetical protein [Escherichia coli]
KIYLLKNIQRLIIFTGSLQQSVSLPVNSFPENVKVRIRRTNYHCPSLWGQFIKGGDIRRGFPPDQVFAVVQCIDG